MAVAGVFAMKLAEAVAAELFEDAAGNGEGDHSLARHPSGGDDAYIRALIGCLGGLAGLKGDRGERPPKRGDRFEVAADDEILAIGHAAFKTARVVVLAGELGEGLRTLGQLTDISTSVADRIVDLGARGLGGGDAAAELYGFDGLEAHDGLGQEAV